MQLVRPVHRVRRAQLAHLVLVCKVRLGRQDRREQLVILGHRALLVDKERPDRQDRRVLLATQVHKALLEHKV